MDLIELLKKLAEAYATKPDEVIAAMHANAQHVYQAVFNKGHGVGQQKGASELETTKTALTTAQTELAAANTKITTLEKENPAAATVTAQYKEELKNQKDSYEAKLAAAGEKFRNAEHSRVVSSLENYLIGKKVDPIIARSLAMDPDVQKRIRVKDDGTHEIMQDGKEIAFAPAEKQTAVGLLGEELIKAKVQPRHILVEGDRGAGTSTGDAGGSGSSFVDKFMQEQEKARAAIPNPLAPTPAKAAV